MLFSREMPRRDPDDDGAPASNGADEYVRIRNHGNRMVNTAQMS